ncbi:MAG: NADH-quinone oxidoreductase subunit K [Candidatus Ozemobacteraceae bacterium]
MGDLLIILVVLTNLRLLASGRIAALIIWVSVQGVILGIFALIARWAHLSPDVFMVGIVALLLKGIVFPWLLNHVTKAVHAGRELEPYVGYIPSILIGLCALTVSLWLGTRLHIPGSDTSRLLVPATLFSVFCGQFLIVSRKNAISQVLGFLVMENGAFMLGVGTLYYAPFLVEIGVLLDMFVAVLILTILIRNMNRAFHTINTHQLNRLRE